MSFNYWDKKKCQVRLQIISVSGKLSSTTNGERKTMPRGHKWTEQWTTPTGNVHLEEEARKRECGGRGW